MDILNDTYEVVELLGKTALFTEERIHDDLVPKGLYKYDLRESDDPDVFYFATIEKHVFVNRAGTVFFAEPIDLGPDGYIAFDNLSEDDYPGFDGTEMTVAAFIDKYVRGV